MNKKYDLTEGKILQPLLLFVIPVFFALFLQAMYSAVDLWVVGKFAETRDVSAVSTGSQIMMTITFLISAFAMGVTVFLGQKIGEKDYDEGGRIIGSGITLFVSIGAVLTVLIPVLSAGLASLMNTPAEAFPYAVSYIRICGAGSIVIISYNLIGSIFRGIGDSKTPLITVAIACVCNIAGDLFFVAVLGMGTKGAAYATVAAQFISVVISLILIRRQSLPFRFRPSYLKGDRKLIKKIVILGAPLAFQDLLVGGSFLVLLAIVNNVGLYASAGVGVAEKVITFMMLVPSSFMQAMAAFVAQNRGAGKPERAIKGLKYAISVSLCIAVVMFSLAFFKGNMLAGIFASNKPETIAAAAEYMKAYAIDCFLTCFLFCFIGYFNGMEYTRFVMIQGIIGGVLIRIPVAFIMSKIEPVSLFRIGLATPCSTVFQIIMCLICFFFYMPKNEAKKAAEKL